MPTYKVTAPDGRTVPPLAKNLAEAYAKATWQDDAIRAEILAQQQATATATALKRPPANPQAAAVSENAAKMRCF